MYTPEFFVIGLNLFIIIIAYFYVYPKYAGNSQSKIAQNDTIASIISVIIVGSVYWGSNHEFNAVITTMNWFWFCLVSFFVMETPLMIWYYKKHNVFSK